MRKPIYTRILWISGLISVVLIALLMLNPFASEDEVIGIIGGAGISTALYLFESRLKSLPGQLLFAGLILSVSVFAITLILRNRRDR